MRLLVVLYGHIGHRGGTYFHRPTIGRYLEGLAEVFGGLRLVAAARDLTPDERRLVFPLPAATIDVRPLRRRDDEHHRGVRSMLHGFFEVLRFVGASPRSGKRSLVLAFAPGPLGLGAALARLIRHFPLVTYFGIDWEEGRRLNRLRRLRNRALQNFLASRADCAICAGEALFRKIGRLSSKCHRTEPILDLPMLARTPSQPLSAPSERSAKEPDGPLRLLYVGTLSPRKGVAELIDAVSRLVRDGLSVRLDIVGDGPEAVRLASQTRTLGLQEVVHLHGYVTKREELVAAYSSSDVVVIPSHTEGFPRVIYEAASMGIPLVATRVGGIPARLTHGEEALLVQPCDVEGLYHALSTVCRSPELRRDISQKLLDFAKQHRDADALAQHAKILASVGRRWYQ